jgi:multicomponent Na+:H+ antiporter subunit C
MTGIDAEHIVYSNPLPSVLMLTAIVVGIATTALALALIVRVREDYGTIEEDEILQINQAEWAAGRKRAAKKRKTVSSSKENATRKSPGGSAT